MLSCLPGYDWFNVLTVVAAVTEASSSPPRVAVLWLTLVSWVLLTRALMLVHGAR